MWRPSVPRKRSEASLLTSNKTQEQPSKSASPSRKSTLSSRSVLTEILKNNPFSGSSRDVSRVQQPVPEDPVQSLNRDLIHIASVYPDVQLDVLRELLLRFDGDSRLQVCVEQLFRYKSEWARGRVLNPPRDAEVELPEGELFRTRGYIEACKKILYNEFKALSRSAIDAVLAEVNYSYVQARPTLQQIAAKTWRATITSFFRKKKVSEEPPVFLVWRDRNGDQVFSRTGDAELDMEVKELFMTTDEDQLLRQTQADYEIAVQINHDQAQEEGALYECQCCFDDVPFEQITTCAKEGHVLCNECVRRTFNEAVFGQSWNKSVNIELATLQCFAPLTSGQCGSHIKQMYLKTAITSTKSGGESWTKFEQRLANDSLNKSGLPIQNCPFCSYAEIKNFHNLRSASGIRWRFKFDKHSGFLLLGIIIVFFQFLIPVLLLGLLLVSLSPIVLASQSFKQALVNLSHRRQTHKFKCRSQTCGKKSCTVCHKQWHDLHVCNEPLILSLRSTVEAARTAALKRVCPHCGMGFVKSSGCNKLVCVCGYAMCYLCRKNIGKAPATADNPAQNWNFNIGLIGRNQIQAAEDEDWIAAGEGYRHFCPHFRPLPGQKCTECDKCDLYKTEDEDAIVRRAGEVAEREWRETYQKDIMSQTGQNTGSMQGLENALVGIDDKDYNYVWYLGKRFERGIWKMMADVRQGRINRQGFVDWLVNKFVVIEDERT